MKRFIILLSFLLSIGLVSAVTISDTVNLKNFGNTIGFKNAGTIQAADLYATDDFKVGDDAEIGGDATVTGALTHTGVADFDNNITQAANKGFTQAAGTGWVTVGTTGISATSSPLNILENLTLASGKSLAMSGASTLTTGSGTTDINGAMTAENISLTQGKRIVLNTAGTQFIEHNTSGNYFGIWGNPLAVDGLRWTVNLTPTSGSDLVATGGASDIDYSASSGITKTGTGAVTVNGNATVATSKTLAITDADKLTVGSVIVPQEMVLTIPIDPSEVDQSVFIADDAWEITKIEEVHTVAQDTAYPNTGNLSIMKCTGTEAPNAGDPMHNTTMWLNSTVNTVVTPTLSGISANLTLADGNRIAFDFNGTTSTLAGGVVTLHMKRV